MSMRRRRITTLDKLKVVVRQARCPICGEHLGGLDGLEFDHETALALGGTDDLENLRAVHKECHARKTTGRRGTSKLSASGDGDTSRAAKIKRLRGETKGKPKPGMPGTRRSKWRKRMNGTVERRDD